MQTRYRAIGLVLLLLLGGCAGGDHSPATQAARFEEMMQLEGHRDAVYDVAFSPDSTTLASASADMSVRVWQVSDGSLLLNLDAHIERVNSVAFHPAGTRLASGAADGWVRVWDTTDGELLNVVTIHNDWVNSVAYSPDGLTLASASDDNTVRLWDVETDSWLASLDGHVFGARGVAFEPDGSMLVAASADQTVRLWGVNFRDKWHQFFRAIWHPPRIRPLSRYPRFYFPRSYGILRTANSLQERALP